MTATEGLSYPLVFLHDCARCLALAADTGLALNPQGYLQPKALARIGAVCRLAPAMPGERQAPQLSFTARLLWRAGLLEQQESALHCATQATATWLQQAPVTQLLALRNAWWFRLMPDRRYLPALAFPDYLARHWRMIVGAACTWVSRQPTDRTITTGMLSAALRAQHLTAPPGVQANLPNVRQDVVRRIQSLVTFILQIALPSLGLVRVADTPAAYRPTAEGRAWLRAALARAGQRGAPEPARAVELRVPGNGPRLAAPRLPPLHVDSALRLHVYTGAPPALTFGLLHVAELVLLPDHADPKVPVVYRLTRESLARGAGRGYPVAEVLLLLERFSGGTLPPEARERVRAWEREIQIITCDPGFRLRLHPEQRRHLLRRRPFRERAAPLAAQDAVWVAQEQAEVLFRYLRRRGYTLAPVNPEPPAALIPVMPRAALPLTALWVMVQTYAELRRYLPGLAQLELEPLRRDLEHVLSADDKTGAARLLASQRTILARVLGDANAPEPSAVEGLLEARTDVATTGAPVGKRDALEAAVAAGQALAITYVDTRGRTTRRRIRPRRLETHNGQDILVAHCELRGAERHFRLDRIVEWQVEQT